MWFAQSSQIIYDLNQAIKILHSCVFFVICNFSVHLDDFQQLFIFLANTHWKTKMTTLEVHRQYSNFLIILIWKTCVDSVNTLTQFIFFFNWDHSFSTCVKFSGKLKFKHTYMWYPRVRNVNFSQNFAYFPNEWSRIYLKLGFYRKLPKDVWEKKLKYKTKIKILKHHSIA